MKRLLLLLILINKIAQAQFTGVINKQFSCFSIVDKSDTITFIVADTSLKTSKPILFFCQGSMPVPLFFDFEAGKMNSCFSNFDLDTINKKYHVVCISMPKTPLIARWKNLNSSYCYITDTTDNDSFSEDYMKNDFCENYTNRANAVLSFLSTQKWVDDKELIVFGHSQGARIAVELAKSNKRITKLGLFGYNPERRIDELIWQARKDAEREKISWHQADSIQKSVYDFYKEICNDDSLKKNPSLIAWKSFSTSSLSALTSLKIPIYIAYGSEDVGANYCDVIPLYFIEQHKNNLTIKRYNGLEHNFFPLKENSKPDYKNGKWKEVLNDFLHGLN